MKLENQVCSLELAKEMKKLGFEQESLFWWGNTIGQIDQSCWRIQKKDDDTAMEYISAYTVAELGEMLPKKEHWESMYGINEWLICFQNGYEVKANTEADARAKMLIYLKKNNLL